MATLEEQVYYASKVIKDQQSQITELFQLHHSCSKGVNVEIAKLKIKAGMWGVIGGMIPVIAAILFVLLKGHV
jgi:hypothetical protein